MAVVYFDTSALIRRYHRTEPGAEQVLRLCRPVHRNTLVISRLTSVEVASALNRLYRERAFDRPTRDRLWKLFRSHTRAQYVIVEPDESTYRLAQHLLFAHTLRAYDALQLAGAIRAQRMLSGLAADFRFCTADRASDSRGAIGPPGRGD